MGKKMIAVTMTLPPEMAHKARIIAAGNNQTRSALMRDLLAREIAKSEAKAKTGEGE